MDTSFSTMHNKDNASQDSEEEANGQADPNMLNALLQNAINQPEKKEKKARSNKRRKKREDRIKVLGVEPVTKRKALDQFGHLEDSDTNVAGQGFDDVLRYMKKMGVQISYQKETHGNNLKSNLKPRLNAKKRGLNVRFDLEGLVVKDENTAKKLKEKTKESFSAKSLTDGADSNGKDAVDQAMADMAASTNDGQSVFSSIDNSNIFTSQYMRRKKKNQDEKKEEEIALDNVDNLQKFVSKKYTTIRRVDKPAREADEEASAKSSAKKRKQEQIWNNLKGPAGAPAADFDEEEINSKHNSDEEMTNMRKIGKKKVQMIELEKDKIAPLLEQQKITSDYKNHLEDKKEYFVEIPDKSNLRIANTLDFSVDHLVGHYKDLYKDKKEKPGAKKQAVVNHAPDFDEEAGHKSVEKVRKYLEEVEGVQYPPKRSAALDGSQGKSRGGKKKAADPRNKYLEDTSNAN